MAAWIGLAVMGSTVFWIGSDSWAEARPGTAAKAVRPDETPTVPADVEQPARATDQAVEAALAKTLPEANFQALPLQKAIERLHELMGVNLHVFWDNLADAGVPTDKPITLSLSGASAGRVLRLILDEAGGGDLDLLEYEVDGGVLLINTRGRLDASRVTEVFNVRELLSRGAGAGYAPREAPTYGAEEGTAAWAADCLIELLAHSIEPDSWESNGGLGSARIYDGVLVVRQSPRVQRQVAHLLEALRAPDQEARGRVRQAAISVAESAVRP